MLQTWKNTEQAAISFILKGFDISLSLSPASQSDTSPFPQPTVLEMIFQNQYITTKLLNSTRIYQSISTYQQVKNEGKGENPCLSLLILDIMYKPRFLEALQVTKKGRLVEMELDK